MKKKINVDGSVFSKTTLLQTCFSFTDSLYFSIDMDGGDYVVAVEPKKNMADSKLETMLKEFRNELLVQETRYKISVDNRKVREAVIHQALFSSLPHEEQGAGAPPKQGEQRGSDEAAGSEEDMLIDQELERILKEAEGEDMDADPLGIRVPWEEKVKGSAGPAEAGGGAKKKKSKTAAKKGKAGLAKKK